MQYPKHLGQRADKTEARQNKGKKKIIQGRASSSGQKK
jgi:hypothetical protein